MKSRQKCATEKTNLLIIHMEKPSWQPEFYCGWKMLVVIDLVTYLASI